LNAGPSLQHEIVVGEIASSLRSSLESVSAAFSDAVVPLGKSSVRIAGGEIQPDASWEPTLPAGRTNQLLFWKWGVRKSSALGRRIWLCSIRLQNN
jgi:hypothetical protein